MDINGSASHHSAWDTKENAEYQCRIRNEFVASGEYNYNYKYFVKEYKGKKSNKNYRDEEFVEIGEGCYLYLNSYS